MIYDAESAFEWLNHSASCRGAAIMFFNALVSAKVASFTPIALHDDPHFEKVLRNNLVVLIDTVKQGKATIDQLLDMDVVVFSLWPVYTLMDESGGIVGDDIRRPHLVSI